MAAIIILVVIFASIIGILLWLRGPAGGPVHDDELEYGPNGSDDHYGVDGSDQDYGPNP